MEGNRACPAHAAPFGEGAAPADQRLITVRPGMTVYTEHFPTTIPATGEQCQPSAAWLRVGLRDKGSVDVRVTEPPAGPENATITFRPAVSSSRRHPGGAGRIALPAIIRRRQAAFAALVHVERVSGGARGTVMGGSSALRPSMRSPRVTCPPAGKRGR